MPKLSLLCAALLVSAGLQAQELNIYSARHYQTDEILYKGFTDQTGIKINRFEAGDAALIERLKSEGAKSPADVILMVDAARLWRAERDGLFQPVNSKVLAERIPANLQGGEPGKDPLWFGFSTRARASSSTTRPPSTQQTSTPMKSWPILRTKARFAPGPDRTLTCSRCSVR